MGHAFPKNGTVTLQESERWQVQGGLSDTPPFFPWALTSRKDFSTFPWSRSSDSPVGGSLPRLGRKEYLYLGRCGFMGNSLNRALKVSPVPYQLIRPYHVFLYLPTLLQACTHFFRVVVVSHKTNSFPFSICGLLQRSQPWSKDGWGKIYIL